MIRYTPPVASMRRPLLPLAPGALPRALDAPAPAPGAGAHIVVVRGLGGERGYRRRL